MDLIIIGGGASGIMAAITAARKNPSLNITITERMDRIGKKILATGNGRCNFTNTETAVCNYEWLEDESLNKDFARYVLNSFTVSDTINFFDELGVVHKIEKNGKVFPFSDQASSVLDVLRNELDRLSVKILPDFEVKAVSKKKKFEISSLDGRRLYSDKVIVSTGGCASSPLGSNGTGFEILKDLGHRITPVFPALVQIKANGVKPLKGIKCFCNVSLIDSTGVTETQYGEVLFTDYGISGPPALQLSNSLKNRKNIRITIDFTPDFTEEQIFKLILKRRKNLSHLSMEHFFTGFLNKRIGNVVSKLSGIQKLSLPVKELTDETALMLAKNIKCFSLDVLGTNSFNDAQVTAGGVCMSEFYKETLESKKIKGLFVTGELFDIYGDCGGFNLQWAWSSGFTAGTAAALTPKEGV